jgi:hypothetical protein
MESIEQAVYRILVLLGVQHFGVDKQFCDI